MNIERLLMLAKSTKKFEGFDEQALIQALEKLQDATKDTARLDALDKRSEAYGVDYHEGNEWRVDGPFPDVRAALDDLIAHPENWSQPT